MSRVIEILGTAPQIEDSRAAASAVDDTGVVPLDSESCGEIVFDNVSFAYPSRMDRQALSRISFRVPAGTSVALVGRSGGGKSTVVQLLQRFFDPTAGSVCIDGVPLKNYDLRHLRGRTVGVVPQEPVIFTGSIAENIGFGKVEGASRDEIIKAAQDAGVMEFARRLPDGLDTVVGPSMGGLSGGEKQRVMIARCLVKNPRILLLDEATSALDASSEAMVNETIERLMADRSRTVLVITHRLTIAQRCDRIIVMDRGHMVEAGTHEELSAEGDGLYAELLAVERKSAMRARNSS